MRWLVLALVACRSSAPVATAARPCPAPSTAPQAVTTLALDPAECPLHRYSADWPPAVHVFTSVAAGAAFLNLKPSELAAEIHDHGPAFFHPVGHGYFHESDVMRAYSDVVFARGGQITIVASVIEKYFPMPSDCGNARGSDSIAAEIVKRTTRSIGHFRVVREADLAQITLPSLRATRTPARSSRCERIETYRIEDHFIDLDTGEWLGAYGQAFGAPAYEPDAGLPATALGFDKVKVADDGSALDLADERCQSSIHYFDGY